MKIGKKVKDLKKKHDKFKPFSLTVTENESEFTRNLEKET